MAALSVTAFAVADFHFWKPRDHSFLRVTATVFLSALLVLDGGITRVFQRLTLFSPVFFG